MNILSDPFVYLVVTIVLSVATYFIKHLLVRLSTLEAQMQTKIDDVEARQLIQDKTEPVNANIAEIKEKLDKLFDLYIANLKKD